MSGLAETWRGPASDYFDHFTDGRYDERAFLWFIYPENEIHEFYEGAALVFGRAGADGIEFAYRRDHSGICAFYPIEAEWRPVAPDIATFETEWLSGRLKV